MCFSNTKEWSLVKMCFFENNNIQLTQNFDNLDFMALNQNGLC